MLPDTINILGNEIALSNLITGIIIISSGFIIATLVNQLIKRVLGKYIPDNIEIVLKRIIYWSIIIFSIISALSFLGIDFTGLLLAGGIAGIIIGFATQSVVSNLISGLFLHLDKPVKIGDPIEIVGTDISGIIVDITAFSTRIRTFDGVLVRVPNDKFFTSQLKNFNAYIARRIEFTMDIKYDQDINIVKEILSNLLDKHQKILAQPKPLITAWELADSSIKINVRAWIPSSEWFNIRIELLQLLKEEFDRHGIEIPFPQMTIWFGKSKQAI